MICYICFTVVLLIVQEGYFNSSCTCQEKHSRIISLFIFGNTKLPYKQRESWVQSYKAQKRADANQAKEVLIVLLLELLP